METDGDLQENTKNNDWDENCCKGDELLQNAVAKNKSFFEGKKNTDVFSCENGHQEKMLKEELSPTYQTTVDPELHERTSITLTSASTVNLSHVSEKIFVCNICNKAFARKRDLGRHSRIHYNEKPFTCEICNKSFSQKSNLDSHLRIHSGEKRFTCEVCKKLFSRKDNLAMHLRMHFKEKPFHCDICGKSFSVKSNFIYHSRIHSGVRPYQCNYCDKRFVRKDHLDKHERIHVVQT